jgi:hypothetical protein
MAHNPMAKVVFLRRGHTGEASNSVPPNDRLHGLSKAFGELNITAESVLYSDAAVREVGDRLLRYDGVMVWVDPLSEGQDRSRLDPMLREVAAAGVWVSTHPDTILKMGTKEVLVRTRALGWGSDSHLYRSVGQFQAEFPIRLAHAGVRVLKQNRGNAGIGTWKVELLQATAGELATIVNVQEAHGGAPARRQRLDDFMRECEQYFGASGGLIDQAFQARVSEGMVRCYLAQDRVVGFSTQSPRNIQTACGNHPSFSMDPAKTMHDEAAASFQLLRVRMESEWLPAMQRLLALDTPSLPALWDADFLYGPKTADGEDTYVLCEINVSAVLPFPEQASGRIARAALPQVLAAKQRRASPHPA